MKRVLMYESSVIEGKLMEYALDMLEEKMDVSCIVLGMENPQAVLHLSQSERIGHVPDLIMINLDKRDDNQDAATLVNKLRNLPGYKNVFIQIWTNHLKPLLNWEFAMGPGCYAHKPFEFDVLVDMLKLRISELSKRRNGEA